MEWRAVALPSAMSRPGHESLTFVTSGGDRLVGVLYLPAEQPAAAVVTTGPLTSVKEQATGAYARALAARGFAALAFDHRTFGRERGRAAPVRAPRGQGRATSVPRSPRSGPTSGPATLPVVAVGVCAGGGYMARAVADDERIAAFAGVAGLLLRRCRVRPSRRPTGTRRRSTEGSRPRSAGERRARPRPSRRSHPMVATWRCRCARRTSSTAHRRGAVDNYTNGFAVQSLAYTTRSTPKRPRRGSRVPFLLVHSEHALAPPLARQFYGAVHDAQVGTVAGVAGSDRLLRRPAPHRSAVDAIAEHFRTTLA